MQQKLKQLSIHMVRHGRSVGNQLSQMSGHTDHKLVPEGISELGELKKKISYQAFDRLYSSDLYRAYTTAEILFDQKVEPQNRRYGLREIYFGDVENQVYDSNFIKVFYKDFFGEYPKTLNAENGIEFQERIMTELQEIADEMVRDGLDSAMIVAHAGTIRMAHFTFLKTPIENYRDIEIENGKGYSFELDYEPVNRTFKIRDYQKIDV